jgi:hypothetical protein
MNKLWYNNHRLANASSMSLTSPLANNHNRPSTKETSLKPHYRGVLANTYYTDNYRQYRRRFTSQLYEIIVAKVINKVLVDFSACAYSADVGANSITSNSTNSSSSSISNVGSSGGIDVDNADNMGSDCSNRSGYSDYSIRSDYSNRSRHSNRSGSIIDLTNETNSEDIDIHTTSIKHRHNVAAKMSNGLSKINNVNNIVDTNNTADGIDEINDMMNKYFRSRNDQELRRYIFIDCAAESPGEVATLYPGFLSADVISGRTWVDRKRDDPRLNVTIINILPFVEIIISVHRPDESSDSAWFSVSFHDRTTEYMVMFRDICEHRGGIGFYVTLVTSDDRMFIGQSDFNGHHFFDAIPTDFSDNSRKTLTYEMEDFISHVFSCILNDMIDRVDGTISFLI